MHFYPSKTSTHELLTTGLPDFSWHNIPNWGKYTKLPQNKPNVHKEYQLALK
jgi:hypothetical protein